MWNIDENKTPSQLSAGMKVKYALALALSHNARLLILDEPTSGIDPVSRDELLDIFMGLCDKGVTILFSTHITSDLDKCADNILYIKNGQLLADCDIRSFVDGYKVLELQSLPQAKGLSRLLIGLKRTKDGYSALIKTEDIKQLDAAYSDADLETIMVHIEKEATV